MIELVLRQFHQRLGAHFLSCNGLEAVAHYGELLAEHTALQETTGWLDLGFRSRLRLTGADRVRFLHGQVTNDVKALAPGQGCYAALLTAKGKMISDLNIHRWPEEILLDFEPGLSAIVAQRLKKYIISEDVQVADLASHCGLLSLQGPRAATALAGLVPGLAVPEQSWHSTWLDHPDFGRVYCVNQPRNRAPGWDLIVPLAGLETLAGRLADRVRAVGGRPCGWQALEMARIEAGLPRFGQDMDETNLPPEAGIEARAISYTKGCYIGQEVIARLRTYGQVTKALRGLRLADDLKDLPQRGDKLLCGEREVGSITSALASPALGAKIALGYVRREHNQPGTELTLRTVAGDSRVEIVSLPFDPRSLGV